MNIFLITKSDSIGGAQIFVKDLIELSLLKGNKTMLITRQGTKLQSMMSDDVQVVMVSCNSVLAMIQIVYTLIKAKNLQPKLKIFSNSTVMVMIGRLIRLFLKDELVEIHHGLYYRSTNSKFLLGIVKTIEKISSKLRKRTIFVSRQDRDDYVSFIGKKNFIGEVIYNGTVINEDLFKVRKNRKLKIVTVARHCRQKNYVAMLESIKGLDVELVAIGDGELFSRNVSFALELGVQDQVTFMGYRSDVRKALRSCDIFLLLSFWEGLPISILEAIAEGLPVIASDVGGVKESVINGYNGFLIEKGENARNEIELFLEMSQEEFGLYSKNSFTLAKKNFDKTQNYERYFEN